MPIPKGDIGKQSAEAAAVWVDTKSLKPWVKNPRKNDAAVLRVADSIKRFGFGSPILARRADGEIIAGHTRLKAALSLGIDKVPVRYLDLDPADAHLLALADNKLGEIAEWDNELVAEILADYNTDDTGLAGWTDREVSELTGLDDDCDLGDIPETGSDKGERDNLITCPKCGLQWAK